MWLGCLDEYPDYMTQGESLKELEENLKDIYSDVTQGHVPGVRRLAERGPRPPHREEAEGLT
jgi:predicted RNase H-like HicB family nuclease